MGKNVYIISSSFRSRGNSATLARSFAKGAEDAGHRVQITELRGQELGYCRGCRGCTATHRCVLHDDADRICQEMIEADVLVFATPIYFFSISAQLKTLLDRTNAINGAPYKFRDIYFLASAYDEGDEVFEGALKALDGWLCCFGPTKLCGSVCAGGVDKLGEVAAHPEMQKAYEMGKNL